jgi:hypothetical protein
VAFSRIQTGSQDNGASSVTTIAVTLGATVSSGSAVFVVCGWAQDATKTVTVTDDKSNTYTAVDKVSNGAAIVPLCTFYCLNVTNAPKTITATMSAAQTFGFMIVDEFSGVATSAALTAHNMQQQAAPGTGTDAITSGSITATSGNLLWGGAITLTNGNISIGTGFTLSGSLGTTVKTEWLTQGANTAATFTDSGTGSSICGCMQFSPAGGDVLQSQSVM